MLFIMVMDVLSHLFDKADVLNLLRPLSGRQIGHRVFIYADDVAIFATPQQGDINTIRTILEAFGEASGLKANMEKSAIMPIRCTEEDENIVKENMPCIISAFPCKYLGLPLSLH